MGIWGRGSGLSQLPLQDSFSSLKTKTTVEEVEITEQGPRRECERKALLLQHSYQVYWCFCGTKAEYSVAHTSLEYLAESFKPGRRLRETPYRLLLPLLGPHTFRKLLRFAAPLLMRYTNNKL